MPAPTLGCQIAPNYDHSQWPYNSDDSSETESETEEHVIEAIESASSAQHELDIEKAETQCDTCGIAPASRPTTLQRGRSKSSRKEPPQTPVGFWHWQMVR